MVQTTASCAGVPAVGMVKPVKLDAPVPIVEPSIVPALCAKVVAVPSTHFQETSKAFKLFGEMPSSPKVCAPLVTATGPVVPLLAIADAKTVPSSSKLKVAESAAGINDFLTSSVLRVLVMSHVNCALDRTKACGIVKVCAIKSTVARFVFAVLPEAAALVSVQLPAVMTQVVFGDVSVTTLTTFAAPSVTVPAETAVF